MVGPRVFPRVLAGIFVLASGVVDAQAPAPMTPGNRVQVTLTDGTSYAGVIAAKPQDPLWQFITPKGGALNYRLDQLLSVRLLGRDERIIPSWPSAPLVVPMAEIRLAGGTTVEVGVHRWPTFEIIRDGTAAVERSNAWHAGQLVTLQRIESATGAAKPGPPDFEFEPVPPSRPKPQGE